jgi:hypothetical protein
MKLAIEHAGMDKNKFASQLEDLRRAADNEARGYVGLYFLMQLQLVALPHRLFSNRHQQIFTIFKSTCF